MTYNPFKRGEYPVGVRTIETKKEPRSGRKMTVEVWYPATEEYKGKDTNEATLDRFTDAPSLPEQTQQAVRDAALATVAERLPLIMYFHGGYGYRREMTNVCTHLASCGYIVAAPDFPGDNINDLKLGDAENDSKISEPIDKSAIVRPVQASFVINCLLSDSAYAPFIDSERIGAFGLSMGGFTALRLNSIDERPKATVAIAPVYGKNDWIPQLNRIEQLEVDDWNRPVPTFLLAGERDTFVLLENLRELAEKIRQPKRFAVLRNAGHFHWAAGAEQGHEIFRMSYLSGNIADPEIDARAMGEAMRPFSELAPAWHASDTARALCLAHFDENLKGNGDAREFLDNRLAETFAGRGINIGTAENGKTEKVGA